MNGSQSEQRISISSFSPIPLSDREFNRIKKLIYETAGINLTAAKKELVKSRLSKRLRDLKIYSFSEYIQYVTKNDNRGIELINLVNAITTNKTEFFREEQHFKYLEEVIIPELNDDLYLRNERVLRIWVAGCSSGEEPYTIAMVFDNYFKNDRSREIKILATDICTDVLQKAAAGLYRKDTLNTVPSHYITNYFDKIRFEDGSYLYQIKDKIKKMILFKKLNLISSSFPLKHQFDIIFCRNVMIYFDRTTQQKLIEKFYKHIKNNGYLLIGHSESLMGINPKFIYQKPAIYKKVEL